MTDTPADIARASIRDSAAVIEALLAQATIERVVRAADVIADALTGGNTLLIFGNGGSAADGTHIAAEFLGRFLRDRSAVSALSLSDNTSAVTAIGNDYGFEHVFERQIEGLGQVGDVALAISTSGDSENVLRGVAAARRLGLHSVGLTGAAGGMLAGEVDVWIPAGSDATPRIQEAHTVIAHVLCDLVERRLA